MKCCVREKNNDFSLETFKRVFQKTWIRILRFYHLYSPDIFHLHFCFSETELNKMPLYISFIDSFFSLHLPIFHIDYNHWNFFYLFYVIPSLPIPWFHWWPYISISISFKKFICLQGLVDLILIFVKLRYVRLITTSLPSCVCSHANNHWCRISMTFQVQGTISIQLILTQNLSEKKKSEFAK